MSVFFILKLIPILASFNSCIPCVSIFCEKSISFVAEGGGTKRGGKTTAGFQSHIASDRAAKFR